MIKHWYSGVLYLEERNGQNRMFRHGFTYWADIAVDEYHGIIKKIYFPNSNECFLGIKWKY